MFERLRNFATGMGRLIRDPNLLVEYETALTAVKHDLDRADRNNETLHRAYDEVKAEVSFRKEMDDQGIGVRQRYVDTELGVEPLPDKTGSRQTVRVSYIEITGFAVNDGDRYIQTNLGAIKADRFLDRRDQGELVTMEQLQTEMDHRPPVLRREELIARMEKAGFTPAGNTGPIKDLIMWRDGRTDKEFGLGDWQDVKDFVTAVEQEKIAGMLFYPSGEMVCYRDPTQFIKDYAEEMDARGPNGVSARTITKDPAVRKAVDDLIYGEFGEENPNGLDYYETRQASESQETAFQQEAFEMEI